ncbi:MAG: protein translocase subunit SecF [Nanoarchaeota archaeon]|nr:protein translocase subunit SecF [Nanoarchaeota archaeon]
MGIKKKLLHIYDVHYKKLLWIPIIILILSIVQIGYQINTTGDFIGKGVSLKGGLSVQIDTLYSDVTGLKEHLISDFPNEDFDVRLLTKTGKQTGLIIEATEGIKPEALLKSVKDKLGDAAPELEDLAESLGTVSPRFSEGFFRTAIIAVLVAFAFMGLVVFYYFRIPIPSLAVILCAFSDIVCSIAIFNLLGGKLGTGGVAAFLMLIGYSVDTDILLSTRVLKHGHGTILERILDAMKTGMTMSITTIAAVTVGLIFSQSEVLKQIFTILLIGLSLDVIMTWLQNTAILRWYLEPKKPKEEGAGEEPKSGDQQ